MTKSRKSHKGSHTSLSARLFGRRSLPLWLGGILICVVYVLVFYNVISPYNHLWRAIYGDETSLPEGYSICGIDISHHQGNIDWEQLSRARVGGTPINFVFVKATEGKSFVDKQFNYNFRQSLEFGMTRGAYHFFVPNVSASEQARFFIRQVQLEPGDLPPVLDFEKTGSLSAEEIRKAALSWLKPVEAHYGVKPIIYTNLNFKQSYFSTPEFDQYPFWIAHYYVPELRYTGHWRFWQYTDRGRLAGVGEYVDLNIYNGSMYDLRQLTIPDTQENDNEIWG